MNAAKVTKPPEQTKKSRRDARAWPLSFIHPCQCRHHADHSEILALVEASGSWEVVAVIQETGGSSPKAMAEFLCSLMNDNQSNRNLLLDAVDALESCLEEGPLTFSSEQAADSVVTRIKKNIK